MGLLKRLRSLAGLTSVGLVPIEISAALVDDLYSALRSQAIGAITGVLVGGIAASRTGSAWLIFLTVAAACVAFARGLLTIEYYKRKSSIVGNGAALGRWERWYAVGAVAYGACLGSMCFVGFVFTDDPFCQLLLTVHAVGFTAGTTARTSSRPWIAITQVSSIVLPIALASALRGGLVDIALSAIIRPGLSRHHRTCAIFGWESRYGCC